MKILIVSRSFYPMNNPRSFRTTELVKEFIRLGHGVTVVTHHDKKQNEFKNNDKLIIKELKKPSWRNIHFGNGRLATVSNRIVYRLLSNYFDYPSNEYFFLVKDALKNENNYDLIISIATPHTIHWGVAKAVHDNKNLTKTWIADCGDPYLIVESDTFKKPFYFRYIERSWAKLANYVTVPINDAIEAYDKKVHHKIKVVPQGFNFDEIKDCIINGKINNNIPNFAYGGGFILGKRDPTKFLEYLNSLKNDFRFFIYSHNLEFIQHLADQSRGRIHLLPVTNRMNFLKILSKMDFVVNFENTGKNQVPSKLIDYAILKKPILSVSSNKIDKNNIEQFLNLNFRDSYMVEDVDKYNINFVANQFLDLHFKNID